MKGIRMNYVPEKYHNIINPWMTENEIKRAIKAVERLISRRIPQFTEEELKRFLVLDYPKRDWSKNK
jgi:hypothetical protein